MHALINSQVSVIIKDKVYLFILPYLLLIIDYIIAGILTSQAEAIIATIQSLLYIPIILLIVACLRWNESALFYAKSIFFILLFEKFGGFTFLHNYIVSPTYIILSNNTSHQLNPQFTVIGLLFFSFLITFIASYNRKKSSFLINGLLIINCVVFSATYLLHTYMIDKPLDRHKEYSETLFEAISHGNDMKIICGKLNLICVDGNKELLENDRIPLSTKSEISRVIDKLNELDSNNTDYFYSVSAFDASFTKLMQYQAYIRKTGSDIVSIVDIDNFHSYFMEHSIYFMYMLLLLTTTWIAIGVPICIWHHYKIHKKITNATYK